MPPVLTTLLTPNPASGNTTTDGTEQTLASATAAAGIYLLKIDCSNMVDGDTIELRGYSKVNGSATRRLEEYVSISDGGKGNIPIGPIHTPGDVQFTIKRIAGTDRSYQWGVLNFTGA